MRISDWSSDVCSSDLQALQAISDAAGAEARGVALVEVIDARHIGMAVVERIVVQTGADRIVVGVGEPAVDRVHHRGHRRFRIDLVRQYLVGLWLLDRKSTRLNSSH